MELYDLNVDISEAIDLADQQSNRVKEMKTELMNWLDAMDTQYAEVDSTWDEAASTKRLENYKTVFLQKLQKLQKQRKEMLSSDWQPNDNWWGSEVP